MPFARQSISLLCNIMDSLGKIDFPSAKDKEFFPKSLCFEFSCYGSRNMGWPVTENRHKEHRHLYKTTIYPWLTLQT